MVKQIQLKVAAISRQSCSFWLRTRVVAYRSASRSWRKVRRSLSDCEQKRRHGRPTSAVGRSRSGSSRLNEAWGRLGAERFNSSVIEFAEANLSLTGPVKDEQQNAECRSLTGFRADLSGRAQRIFIMTRPASDATLHSVCQSIPVYYITLH